MKETEEQKKRNFSKLLALQKIIRRFPLHAPLKVKRKKKKNLLENPTFPNSKLLKARKKVSIAALIFSLKVSGENKSFESNKPDSSIYDNFIAEELKYLKRPVFSRSEPVDNKISAEPSRQKSPAKKEPFFEKVTELKSVNCDIEAGEVPKKLESKSQKTLFDF